MQFSKKIFGDSDKKAYLLQQQIPPRLSTMRTTVGLRFLYGSDFLSIGLLQVRSLSSCTISYAPYYIWNKLLNLAWT